MSDVLHKSILHDHKRVLLLNPQPCNADGVSKLSSYSDVSHLEFLSEVLKSKARQSYGLWLIMCLY